MSDGRLTFRSCRIEDVANTRGVRALSGVVWRVVSLATRIPSPVDVPVLSRLSLKREERPRPAAEGGDAAWMAPKASPHRTGTRIECSRCGMGVGICLGVCVMAGASLAAAVGRLRRSWPAGGSPA